MDRTWLISWCSRLAFCALALAFGTTHQVAGQSPRIEGDAIDGSMPIAYRLAPVERQGSKQSAPNAAVYAPTTTDLTTQVLPVVQRGYGLAQRGALFAAETEFVQALRRVSQAKDAATDTDAHSKALAAGLRALEEAEDFVPRGTQLEAELDVEIVASSHRTPVLQRRGRSVSVHEASTLYHAYAEREIARAVNGEQAGSMALHGLGKIYARLAERSDDDVHFTRKALTMHSAALAVRPDNHLAANELGVLLCRNGRPADAARMFERTIDLAASATAYHNLAVAQRKLGLAMHAVANEQQSQRLAALERASGAISRRAGVAWVSPAEMASTPQPGPLPRSVMPVAMVNTAQSVATPTSSAPLSAPEKSRWQKTVELAKSFPLPRVAPPNVQRESSRKPPTPAPMPFSAPPLPDQTLRH